MMTIHTVDLSSFGPAELKKVQSIIDIMIYENDGHRKAPQIICMDDTNGKTWATGKAGNIITK